MFQNISLCTNRIVHLFQIYMYKFIYNLDYIKFDCEHKIKKKKKNSFNRIFLNMLNLLRIQYLYM